MEAFVTRRERFSAAHRIFRKEWDTETNKEMFGLCSNPNWHGHNYELFVTVKGEIKPETGFVVNIKQLSKIIREYVIDKIDHKNMNTEVDFMEGRLASTENLAVAIWNELEQPVNRLGKKLHCIKIKETENNFVEYYGQ
ncbi:MAG: 6-carboxytetrahydropterin synthase [Bacteroidales bacterium]|nr:6-carboxytetrahydropterin synthase [Bacteroidales bacterium]